MSRVVAWFSRGAASAVATKLAIAEHGSDVVVACIALDTEHEDSARFADACEAWFGHPITSLRSERYKDTWGVWEGELFLVGPQGAKCTGILKKAVRHAFQRPDDRHVFGYTADEAHRIPRLLANEPGLDLLSPLIDRGLTKADCHALLESQGIKRPALYDLGYQNNNCIPCVKGGMGYWNAIRRDFPEAFARMALLERDIGHAVLSEEIPGGTREKRPVWLDELDPDRGDFRTDQPPDCSVMCAITEVEIGATR